MADRGGLTPRIRSFLFNKKTTLDMAKNTTAKAAKNTTLKLTAKTIRGLQEKFKITNFLSPTGDDQDKMGTLDVLLEVYFQGTRHLGDAALEMDDIEDTVDLRDLAGALGDYMGKA